MVIDVIGPDFDPHFGVDEEETPDLKTQRLYDMLHKANEPLWEGCSKHSQLSAVPRLLNIKFELHKSEKCYVAILQFGNEALPIDNKYLVGFMKQRGLLQI